MFHNSVSDGLDGGPMLVRPFPEVKMIDKTGNQVNILYPYRYKGGWVFDDSDTGLYREAFVLGTDTIISTLVGKRKKFKVIISHSYIPNETSCLKKVVVKDKNGVKSEGWYKDQSTNMVGWLCPAVLKYFRTYPKEIHFKIE